MKSTQKPVHVHVTKPKGVMPNGVQPHGGNENVVQAHSSVEATKCLAMLKEATSVFSKAMSFGFF